MTTSLRLLLAVFLLLLISVAASASAPLTLSNLETLFDSKVSSGRIVDLINERKVCFQLTKGALKRLQGLGAPPSVIKAIGKNAVAGLHVESEPPGAEVFLDGMFKGITPALFSKVLPGKHELQVGRVKGYQEYQAEIELLAGETRKDKVVLKKREQPIASIDSTTDYLPEVPIAKQEINTVGDAAELPMARQEIIRAADHPSEATIAKKEAERVGGQRGSEVPKTKQESTGGGEIPVVKDRPVSAPKSPAAGQLADRQLVTVHVTTEPVSASIYLNDKYIGASPAQFLVPVGNHQLRLVPTLIGRYEIYEKQILVSSNALNVFFLRLDAKRD